jgi:hypothetical protein
MLFRQALTVVLNAIMIGTAFTASYYVAAENTQQQLAIAAFGFGILCYLIIRWQYKQDNATNKLMFRSYRLAVWSVPILLFIINFHLYFETMQSREFIEYHSFEDLMYLGPFVIAIWPLFLIAFVIGNCLIFIEKLFQTLHFPVIIILSVMLIMALAFAYIRLYKLKQAAKINFSIPFAATQAFTPIIFCTYFLIELMPEYLK